MLWHGTATNVIGLSTGPADLVVPAVVEVPVTLQLWTTDTTIKAVLDLPSPRPAMLLHVAVGDLVRDALVAQSRHQPVEHRTGVTIADSRAHFLGPEVCPNLINQRWRACEAANGMDQPNRVVDRAALPVLNFGMFQVACLTTT